MLRPATASLSVVFRRVAACAVAVFATTLAWAPAPARAGVTTERRPEIFCEFSSRESAIDVERVRIFVDDRDVTAQAQVANWRVSYTPAEDLTVGDHHVRVVVYDEAGNRRVKTWSFTVDPEARDTAGPVIRFEPPTPGNGEVLSGAGASDGGARVEVRFDDAGGVGLDPSTVSLFLSRDGGPFENVTARSVFQRPDRLIYRTGAMPGGTYLFRAVASDRLGNRGQESYTSFSVDDQPPAVAGVSVSPSPFILSPWKTSQADWLVRVSDAPFDEVERVVLTITGPSGEVARLEAGPVRGEARLSWDGRDASGRPVPAGVYRAQVVAVDYAGAQARADWNQGLQVVVKADPSDDAAAAAAAAAAGDASTAASEEPAVLTRAGRLPLRVDRIQESLRNQDRIEVTGDTTPGAEVEVFVNSRYAGSAIADGGGEFVLRDVGLEEGRNRLHLVATDLDTGRQSARVRANVTLTVDTRGPAAVRLREPADGSTVAYGTTSVTVSGDTEAGAVVHLFRDGSQIGQATAGRTGRFSLTAALAVGENSFTARAIDEAGNEGTESLPVRITRLEDTTPEAPEITSPSDGDEVAASQVAVEGTTQAGSGARVYLYVNGVLKSQAFVRADGSFRAFAALDAGENRIQAKLVMLGGEESPLSPVLTVTRTQ